MHYITFRFYLSTDTSYFLFALGQLSKPLFVLLLQIKDALFFGICIIWRRFCEERQQCRAKLIAGFIGLGKRIGGGFRFAFNSCSSFLQVDSFAAVSAS